MSHKIYREFSINEDFYFTVTCSRYGLLNYRVIKAFFPACCEISKYATLLTEVDNVCNRKEHKETKAGNDNINKIFPTNLVPLFLFHVRYSTPTKSHAHCCFVLFFL